MTPTVPLADASTEWTVSFDYDDDRELDRDQLARALESGEIDADTIVWREGMEEWLPIKQVAGLADLLKKKGDATGGFLGTGMELDAGAAKLKKKRPPPHPAKRRSEPPRTGTAAAVKPPLPPRAASLGDLGAGKTSGKARALSAGTLFVDDGKPKADKPETAPKQEKPSRPKLPSAPKAPVPEWKAKLAEAAKIDTEPPSSGTPALSDLTTGLKPTPKMPESSRDDVFGVTNDPGTLLSPPAFDLGPPTIDVESPEPPPAVAEDAVEDERESEPPPAKAAGEAEPRGGGASGRTIAGILLIAGALAFSVWWFGFKAPSSASTEPRASAPVESPTPPAPSPTTAENTEAPAPTESAAPVESATPPSTATTKVAAEPHGVAPSNTSRPVAGKKPPTTAHTAAATAKPATEPTPPPTATATATAAKDLPPFSQSAAIAALNSAAGSASACRKEGDPSGMAHVVITFAPSGRVTTARVNGPPFAGTPTGGCIAARMRGAHVPAFSGGFVTVSKTVVIH